MEPESREPRPSLVTGIAPPASQDDTPTVDPFRPGKDRGRRVALFGAISIIAITGAFLLWSLPEPAQGSGSLDECLWGWPVVKLDGGTDYYLPVISWPAGLTYDEEADVLRNFDDLPMLRRGDRVALKGSIVDMGGDIPPCFYSRGIKLDTIGPEPGA